MKSTWCKKLSFSDASLSVVTPPVWGHFLMKTTWCKKLSFSDAGLSVVNPSAGTFPNEVHLVQEAILQ